MSVRSSRVTVYGFLGMGNIGNEGSLGAFLSWLTSEMPDCDVRSLAADAEQVARDHGIPGARLMSYRSDPDRTGPLASMRKMLGRVWDVPRTFAAVRGTDVVAIPGMGVFETSMWTRPWGLPYWQFLVALACRVERRRLLLVSVGAERATHPVTRFFHRWTVRLSDYCSYRDPRSRDAMIASGARGRPGSVAPDLAFALPEPDPGLPARAGHLVFGVMEYEAPSAASERDGTSVYSSRVVDSLIRLVAGGRTVTLVVGDLADLPLAERIRDDAYRLRADLPPGALVVSDASTMAELMREMQQAQVVVGSRFHNLVSGLLVARPTVSLSYAQKNRDLLEDFGLGHLSQPIDDFDVETLLEHVELAFGLAPTFEKVARDVLDRLSRDAAAQFAALKQVIAGKEPQCP